LLLINTQVVETLKRHCTVRWYWNSTSAIDRISNAPVVTHALDDQCLHRSNQASQTM